MLGCRWYQARCKWDKKVRNRHCSTPDPVDPLGMLFLNKKPCRWLQTVHKATTIARPCSARAKLSWSYGSKRIHGNLWWLSLKGVCYKSPAEIEIVLALTLVWYQFPFWGNAGICRLPVPIRFFISLFHSTHITIDADQQPLMRCIGKNNQYLRSRFSTVNNRWNS